MTDPWDEPTDDWTEKEAATLRSGDYILDGSDTRLKVLASYAGAAGVPLWYLDVYEPGESTRRIGCHPGEMIRTEVRP